MELTLDAALSSDALWGHAAYFVLLTSMMMRTLDWLRILVIISAFLSIAYAVIILGDPVSAFWESMLVLVNGVQLIRTHWRSLRARFTVDETALVSRYLPSLHKGEARDILDAGAWRVLPAGHVLAEEGAAVSHLTYVAHGTVAISHGSVPVSTCRPGDFIGEMTALIGSGATADAKVQDEAVVWQIEASDLRRIVAKRDGVARALDAAFAQNYRQKILAMRPAAAQPVAAPHS